MDNNYNDDDNQKKNRPGRNARKKARRMRGLPVPFTPIPPLDAALDPDLPIASVTDFRPTEFIIPGYLPRRHVVGIFGPPKSAKSLFITDMLARISIGRDILGRPINGGPQNCLAFVFEDSGDTFKGRFLAPGGNTDRLSLITSDEEDGLKPQEPLLQQKDRFEHRIKVAYDAGSPFAVIFIDMLKSTLPDFTRTKPCQEALTYLRMIARKYDCTIIINMHSKEGDSNVFRTEGSKELIGMPRWTFLVLPIDSRQENPLRVATVHTLNIGKQPPAICFRITSVMIANKYGIFESQPKIEALGQYPFTTNVLLRLFRFRWNDWTEEFLNQFKLQTEKRKRIPPTHPDNIATSPAFNVNEYAEEEIVINNITPGDCIRGIEEELERLKAERKKHLKDAADAEKDKPTNGDNPKDEKKPSDDQKKDDPPPQPPTDEG